MYTEQDLKKISTYREKKERLSWNRKRNSLEALVDKLNSINDSIMELMEKKNVLFDEIQDIRKIMMAECVHPLDMLIPLSDSAKCKFCNKIIKINE